VRRFSFSVISLAAVLAATSAAAQTPPAELTGAQVEVACAPPPALAEPPSAKPRVIGSQDPVPRVSFGRPELLVIDAGSGKGLLLGQDYFFRRLVRFGETYNDKLPHSVHTAGWGRVVAVNEATAIMSVERICSEILAGDYLDPFQVPEVTDDITAVDTTKEPDFTSLGRVLFGADERRTAAIGEFVLIDRGTEQGVSAGMPFAIYRDLRVAGVPLTAVGEAKAVAVGSRMTVVRINRARDAIVSGDYVAPRSK
jgi:hypothetical protein